MQSFYDAGLENWHDYEVSARREIVALMRAIGEKKQMIRMLLQGDSEICVTAILDVDAERGAVVLDCSLSPEQNERILAASQISFETSLDKIRILFACERLTAVTFRGAAAFEMPLPDSLIRLQRREYYRMPTPISNPVRAVIALPEQLGGGTNVFPLADISCGGIAILDNKLLLGDTVGSAYDGVQISLPEIGTVVVSLQIRNSVDMTLLNNKSNRRLGCEFVDISRGNMAYVQKYITKLERERNARIAGLG